MIISPSSTSAILPPTCCLRRNMSDGSTSGGAGETSVCDQCHTGAQTHACDGRCRIQHFSHARTALWSLITDNNNISRYNLAALDCCNGILFTVKDTCRSFMLPSSQEQLQNALTTLPNSLPGCPSVQQCRLSGCMDCQLDGSLQGSYSHSPLIFSPTVLPVAVMQVCIKTVPSYSISFITA